MRFYRGAVSIVISKHGLIDLVRDNDGNYSNGNTDELYSKMLELSAEHGVEIRRYKDSVQCDTPVIAADRWGRPYVVLLRSCEVPSQVEYIMPPTEFDDEVEPVTTEDTMADERTVELKMNSVDITELQTNTSKDAFNKAVGYLATWNFTFKRVDIIRDGSTDMLALYRNDDDTIGYVIGAIWHDDEQHYTFHS